MFMTDTIFSMMSDSVNSLLNLFRYNFLFRYLLYIVHDFLQRCFVDAVVRKQKNSVF